jgi:hypothetical protein
MVVGDAPRSEGVSSGSIDGTRPGTTRYGPSGDPGQGRWWRVDWLAQCAFWWTAVLVVVYEILARHYGGPPPSQSFRRGGPLITSASAGGLIGLLILSGAVRRGTVTAWRALQVAALVPLGIGAAPFGLWATAHLRPNTYDAALLAFDDTLGWAGGWPNASAWAGELFRGHPAVVTVCYIVYAALPLVMAGAMAWEMARAAGSPPSDERPQPRLTLAYVITGVVGLSLYLSLPAAGPAYVFGAAFPSRLPDAFALPLAPYPWAPGAARNCMPSLHLAWALILWRTTVRASALVRWAAIAFVLITALATLGSGEHYLVDLIVAAPFATGLLALVTPPEASPQGSRVRAWALGGGAGLTAVWLLLFVCGPAPVQVLHRLPALAWALTLATVGMATFLEWRRSRVGAGHRAAPEATAA